MELQDLKARRKALKLTQTDMALVLGVTRVTYNYWENDASKMPLGQYIKATKWLDKAEKLVKESKQDGTDN